VYSDDEEDTTRRDIIDIDAVSFLSESAPTSLYRDRRTKEEKAAAKLQGKSPAALKKAERKKLRKARGPGATTHPATEMGAAVANFGVKAEPISPEKLGAPLPPVRDDDTMMDEDEVQDRDEAGRRVRMIAKYGGLPEDEEDDEVNEAQMVDLSESESEEEEEGMEGDFVQVEGYVSASTSLPSLHIGRRKSSGAELEELLHHRQITNPQDDPESKLFMFQFPQLFPHFHPRTIDATASEVDGARHEGGEDVKPDIKPTAAQLRDKRAKEKIAKAPEEGRVGTLVVMKSGKVKMVLGDDIVMNVSGA
jgi:DNA-directed RNA polymerase III subunit RPC4